LMEVVTGSTCYYSGAQDAHFEFSGIVAISGAI
jgi:hypothetical protein